LYPDEEGTTTRLNDLHVPLKDDVAVSPDLATDSNVPEQMEDKESANAKATAIMNDVHSDWF
jgi:hypothetical protein